MKEKPDSIDTQAVHAGEEAHRVKGSVMVPIFQSATYVYGGEEGYHNIRYGRLNNTPNHLALQEKLSELEQGEAALVTASGMAAISATILTVLPLGGHLLAQNSLYGGTQSFLAHDLPDLGRTASPIDLENGSPETWKRMLKPETKAIYVEPMTNPLLQVGDLEAAVRFAKEHNLVSVIDNTFASPVNFNPIPFGFDLAIHSCTKYLNGHSDVVAGCVIGGAEWIGKITRKMNHLGGTLSPHACYLLHRGIKTLPMRVRQQNASALEVASFLESHPDVQRVNYPGLKNHPGHARAAKLFRGFGGMMSFELRGGVAERDRFLGKLRLPLVAPSLGGVESLITVPVITSHAGLSSEERKALGISDTLIRLSVGVESARDLIDDFRQALTPPAG